MAPEPKVRAGPMTPQMTEAAPKVWVEGHHQAGDVETAGISNVIGESGEGLTFGLVVVTDAIDIMKQPVLYKDLYYRRDERCSGLGGEHQARRDLHIMPELHIADEGHSLRHGDVPTRRAITNN